MERITAVDASRAEELLVAARSRTVDVWGCSSEAGAPAPVPADDGEEYGEDVEASHQGEINALVDLTE
jgi:hypothetical protein